MIDYERKVLKTQRAKKKTSYSVLQLGTQSKQSMLVLKVLSMYEQQLAEFNKETSLTEAQILGENAIPTPASLSINCLILLNHRV
jgi:hypothetical protein